MTTTQQYPRGDWFHSPDRLETKHNRDLQFQPASYLVYLTTCTFSFGKYLSSSSLVYADSFGQTNKRKLAQAHCRAVLANMQAWCGCGKLVIPATTLLSRKFDRHASLACRTARLSKPDQRSASRCKHTLRTNCSVAVDEETTATHNPSSSEHKPSFRAFLDFKALKTDLDKHVQNCRDRNSNANPSRVASLYDDFCEAQQRVEKIRNDRNANAKAMKASQETPHVTDGAAADRVQPLILSSSHCCVHKH